MVMYLPYGFTFLVIQPGPLYYPINHSCTLFPSPSLPLSLLYYLSGKTTTLIKYDHPDSLPISEKLTNSRENKQVYWQALFKDRTLITKGFQTVQQPYQLPLPTFIPAAGKLFYVFTLSSHSSDDFDSYFS